MQRRETPAEKSMRESFERHVSEVQGEREQELRDYAASRLEEAARLCTKVYTLPDIHAALLKMAEAERAGGK